jgi:hypothetical protein
MSPEWQAVSLHAPQPPGRTARAVSSSLGIQARALASEARDAASSLSADLQQTAKAATRAAKAQASEFAADVGHELNQVAEEQKVRGVQAMQGFARAINFLAGQDFNSKCQNSIIRGWRPSLAQNARLSCTKQLPDGDLTSQLNAPICEAPNGGRRES